MNCMNCSGARQNVAALVDDRGLVLIQHGQGRRTGRIVRQRGSGRLFGEIRQREHSVALDAVWRAISSACTARELA